MVTIMKKMGTKNADSINARPAAILFGPEQLDQISMFELQFSTTKFLPQYHVIPDQFKFGHTKWNRLLSDWFYSGVTDLQLVPKRGVDVKKALRVIKAHMISSFKKLNTTTFKKV